jgi:hypothetical protein
MMQTLFNGTHDAPTPLNILLWGVARHTNNVFYAGFARRAIDL